MASFALGLAASASAPYAVAIGPYTEANGEKQIALGAYNIPDNSSTYCLIVGNGDDQDNPSNALTIDWNGNTEIAGNIKASGIQALTASNGSTYSLGSAGQALMSNGTNTYWGDITAGAGGNAKIFYGTCSTAAATTAKVVTCADFTSADLVKGALIYVTFDNSNTGAVGSLTMSVNGTAAKSIKHLKNGGLSNLAGAGHLCANQTYLFTYDGTYWVTELEYNTDNNDTSQMYIRHNGGTYVPSTALYKYQILFSKNETTLIPANAVSGSTGTTKTLTTDAFNPFLPIYYYSTTTTVNSGSAISASYLWCAHGKADLRYAFNLVTTLTPNKDVYIVAQMVSPSTCKLATEVNPITQTLPTTEDGYIYIKLGLARTTIEISLTYDHPIFQYNNGALCPYGISTTLKFTGKSVAVSAWSADSTYSGFGFKANISCKGVTTKHVPSVIFDYNELISGNFCPFADSSANTVTIYCKTKPSGTITIPTIYCV